MAFEARTAEQRTVDRADRRRKIEAWAADTTMKKILKDNGKTAETVQGLVEEVTVGLNAMVLEGAPAVARTRMVEQARQSHRHLQQMLVKADVGCKYGLEAVVKLFEAREETEGLTEEQERILKAHLKEQEKTAKKRKGTTADDENEETAGERKVTGGGGQQLQQQQWMGSWPQLCQPYVVPQGAVMMQPGYQQMGGYSVGHQGDGYGGGQQTGQVSGQHSGAIRAGGPEKKWRFPCNNCGNFGHWRHEVVCPNYHIYLARQQQVAAAYHKQGLGGQTVQQQQQQQGGQQQALTYGGMWLLMFHICRISIVYMSADRIFRAIIRIYGRTDTGVA